MNARNLIFFSLWLAVLWSAFPGQIFAQIEVTWDMLEDLDFVETDGEWNIAFGEKVQELNGKTIKIYGFMMPLDGSLQQKHFILSMLPIEGCQFCAPGTQAQFIEVNASRGEGIRYTYDSIQIQGTFELMPDAPMGVYFLMTDAELVED